NHARERLHLFHCHDASWVPLSDKLLARPRLLERIRRTIGDPSDAQMACFNATFRERRLALALGVPLYACDPQLATLGTKSGSREIFRELGLDLLPGT